MIGYHRYLSHRSFKLNKIFHISITYLGMLSGQGSPLFWVALHRHHHKYSDTEKDIHSPKNGFWESSLKWQILKSNKFKMLLYPKDLIKDRYLVFLHKNYYFLYWITFLLLSIISFELSLGLMIGGTILTTCIDAVGNYVLHNDKYGSVSYKTNDKSRNSTTINLLTLGAGYHNNHHAFPNKYKFGKFDLSSFFIRIIKK